MLVMHIFFVRSTSAFSELNSSEKKATALFTRFVFSIEAAFFLVNLLSMCKELSAGSLETSCYWIGTRRIERMQYVLVFSVLYVPCMMLQCISIIVQFDYVNRSVQPERFIRFQDLLGLDSQHTTDKIMWPLYTDITFTDKSMMYLHNSHISDVLSLRRNLMLFSFSSFFR